MTISCAADPAQVATLSRAIDKSGVWQRRHQPRECGVLRSPSSVAAREFAMIPASRDTKPKIALAPLRCPFSKSLGKTSKGGSLRPLLDRQSDADQQPGPAPAEASLSSGVSTGSVSEEEIRNGGKRRDRRMR
jgi:hypothetical protein